MKEKDSVRAVKGHRGSLTNSALGILRVHLKEEELHKDVDLAEIAYETEGYSGSDLKS
jgi:ATP-dependent 26S proteasome regulatory subunit